MKLKAYDQARKLVQNLRTVMAVLEQRDESLARRMRKAAQNVQMNIAEGSRRKGRDRMHRFRLAASAADEIVAGLDIAEDWGYLKSETTAKIRGHASSVIAVLVRITEGKPRAQVTPETHSHSHPHSHSHRE